MEKYRYMICNQPDEEIFYKQCAAIERTIPVVQKAKILTDVDNSKYQEYKTNKGKIVVAIDHEAGCVSVESDEELTHYFQ